MRWFLAVGIALCAATFAGALRYGGDLAGDFPGAAEFAVPADPGPFPRVATDMHGDELRLDEAPSAVGSQVLVMDHFLFACVPPERIVAVSVYAFDPSFSFVSDAVRRNEVVVASDPEAILQVQPDLLLAAGSARADYVDLVRSTGVPVFRAKTIFDNYDSIAEGLALTGYLTGEDSAARKEIQDLRRRIERARARRPEGARPARVLALSSFSTTYGSDSLFNQILQLLGAVNIAAEQGIGPFGSISGEQVAAWNPDWIVTSAAPAEAAAQAATLLASAGVAATTAGRKGQVLVVGNRLYSSMSHHAVAFLEAVAEALYP